MAPKKTANTNTAAKRPIETYEHKGKRRTNNPPVGLVTPQTDPDAGQKKTYAYDPHRDPQLVWAGKAEHTSFEVPTVSLHVHERIEPRTIIEAVRRRNGNGGAAQLPLFEVERQEPLREAIEFYQHAHGWSNRLVAGDSLLVMNSLLEKEGLAGKVQMVYLDPPYGIKYGSNFQPFVNKRDVKDGKDEDLTAEPEQIRAFRDTWEMGIHSYLTYLRDRLLLARELLSETGSVFVQISDENVHHVRELMDEVFGAGNFVRMLLFKKTGYLASALASSNYDYLLWYARDKLRIKHRALYLDKSDSASFIGQRLYVEDMKGNRRLATYDELSRFPDLEGLRFFRTKALQGSGTSGNTEAYVFEGEIFHPAPHKHWLTTPQGIVCLESAKRLAKVGNTLEFVWFYDDFAYSSLRACSGSPMCTWIGA